MAAYLQHVVAFDVLPLLNRLVDQFNVLLAEVLHEHVEEGGLAGTDVAFDREDDWLVQLGQPSEGLVDPALCCAGVALGNGRGKGNV